MLSVWTLDGIKHTDLIMASLIDRADIHKSCKTLENLLSILAAYTDTTNALANIQRKLSKALKEAASVKGTYDVPCQCTLE
jgi:hypothetical protein